MNHFIPDLVQRFMGYLRVGLRLKASSSVMLTCRQKQLAMECADRIRDKLMSSSIFLVHFCWIQDNLAYIDGKPSSIQKQFSGIDELLKHIKRKEDLEAFVLCLINFGYYSAVYPLFDELDLER